MPSFFYKIQSIMSQKYSGDITIVPEIDYSDFLKVMSNPTLDYVLDCVHRGERATWSSKFTVPNNAYITYKKIIVYLK